MKLFLPAIVLLAASVAAPAHAGDVKLQINNGRVSLQARDATVREILAEWGRVGKVTVVNADKVMGTALTLDLQDVPEAQALGIVLRSVSGYMAAARLQPATTGSIYDRIVVMAAPRTALVASGSTAPPPPNQYPQYRGMPGGMPNPTMLDDQDEPTAPPPTYPGMPPGYPGAAQPRGMVLGQPQTQPGAAVPGTIPQGQPGTVSAMPTQPMIPGQMIIMPGQQQVVTPGTGAPGTVSTPQPVKKPGGPGGPGGEN